jgi:hypothetical protein
LAEKGSAEKCTRILKKIAKTNGKDVKPEIYEAYEVNSPYTSQNYSV